MYGKRDATRLRRNYEFIDSNAGNQFKHQFKSQYNTLQDGISCDTVPQPNPETTCAPVGTPNPTTCQTQSPPTQSPQNAGCNILQQQQQHQYAPQQQYPPPPSQQQQQYPEQQQQQQQQQQQPYEQLDDSELRGKELRKLVQHLYVAQARVQLEATEIHKAQAVASSAQSQLEDSANHVRTITATLHNAQQEVAAAAIRAQIAQLQLAAHDQLLFAARQDVDALSSQVVGLQAAEGIVQPKLTVDLHALLDKLRQPLQHFDRPTPVPMIITLPPLNAAPQGPSTGLDMGTAVGQGSVTKTGIREDADDKELVRMKASLIPT